MAIIILEWYSSLNYHGSKAWFKMFKLYDVVLSTVLSIVLLEIILAQHPGEVNSASSPLGT